ncbi:glycine N-acyltransferase-like [Leptodactylus fuscus]|uniref:glycine N-acyltransferase-like n=1 Tax=Leptodactylus fuscus TaxID=238119 RepID=UPI003F4F1629
MLFLTCPAKVTALRNLLTHSFPGSLKAYGAVHYVVCNNPFRLQVLVDQWPEFTSVICRPPLEEMTDDLDPYTNSYFLFSKDPQNLSQMLEEPIAVNWKQKLQIQGCQPQLEETLREISSRHGTSMETISNVLYTRPGVTSPKEAENRSSRRSINLHYGPLDPDEAGLVSEKWWFGGNERSKDYIARCIRMFPSMCARKEAGQEPISWAISEQSAEIRAGYTEEAYRGQGILGNVIVRLANIMTTRGIPLYCHIAADNTRSQSACTAIGYSPVGRWLHWNFQPS